MSFVHLYLCVFLVFLTSCGVQQPAPSNLKLAVDVPVTDETRVRILALRDRLWNDWNEGSDSSWVPMSMFLAAIPMHDTERQRVETAYTNPLVVNCTQKPCSISGQGYKVNAKTTLTYSGVSNPDLLLDSSVFAHVGFDGESKMTICDIKGVMVKKLFIEWPVLRIRSTFEGERVHAVAELKDLSGPQSCDLN